jgi:CheY-like chemotaxis protein
VTGSGYPASEKIPPSIAQLGPVLEDANLLIVDDDDDFCTFLSKVLYMAGARRVVIAHDGVEALEELARDRSFSFDLVLTDLKMPRPDGVQLAASIRTAGFTEPILIVTAFPEPEVHDAAHRLDGVIVVGKPFNPVRLLMIAASLLGRGRD